MNILQFARHLHTMVIVLFILSACQSEIDNTTPTPAQQPEARMIEVLRRHEDQLLAVPGVVGVGIGQSTSTGAFVINVMVDKKTPELEKKVPDTLEGYAVELITTGEITTQPVP
jgi:hypothetical protein